MDGQAPATTLQQASMKAEVSQPANQENKPTTTLSKPKTPKSVEDNYKANLRVALSALSYATARGFDKVTAEGSRKAVIETICNLAPPKHIDKRLAGKKVVVVVIWDVYTAGTFKDDKNICHTFVCENETAAWQVLYSFARDAWYSILGSDTIMPDNPEELIGTFFDSNVSEWAFDIFSRRVVSEK